MAAKERATMYLSTSMTILRQNYGLVSFQAHSFPLCEHIGTPPSAKSHQLQPYIDRQTCEAEEQAQQVETGRLCCTRFIWDLLSGTNY